MRDQIRNFLCPSPKPPSFNIIRMSSNHIQEAFTELKGITSWPVQCENVLMFLESKTYAACLLPHLPTPSHSALLAKSWQSNQGLRITCGVPVLHW